MKASRLLLLLACLCIMAGLALAAPAQEIRVVTIEGAIDPALADYMERAVKRAEADHVEAVIIRLNTPGGLGTSMDKMTGLLLNSRVPIVVYVAPSGATAFSAGTFITLAANFAVMHPGATIGAAHPVSLLGSPPQPDEDTKAKKQTDIMTEKITNAYAMKARSIAEQRGRNAAWADRAVRVSDVATAAKALKLGVIDTIQPSMAGLLAWLDGRATKVGEGTAVTLHTKGAKIVDFPPSLKDRILHQLADPNLLMILIVLAAMGILFELQNPGAILPGVVGGIALLSALYAMSVLPVTTAGLALIGFGLLLLVMDIKIPSHGILSVGGIASFILGGIMLIDTRYVGVAKVSLTVVIALTVLLAGFFLIAIGAVVRAHRRQPTTGSEGMLGAKGRTLSFVTSGEEGLVFVAGEEWRARSQEGSIPPSERVEVVGMEGLTLIVKRGDV